MTTNASAPMDATSASLQGHDYAVLISMMLVALAIGFYYAWKDRSGDITDYYFGAKTLPPIPLGLSISLTFMSAYTVIGLATQTFFFGLVTCWMVAGNVLAQGVAHCYYIPLIRRLNLVSIYEFLERRFHRSVRTIASSLSIINYVIFMGINMYVPAIALNAVTTLELNTALLVSAFVCTFYTTLGGIKAVVWTDSIQAVVMISGQVGICCLALGKVGGFSNVYRSLNDTGRINLWTMTGNPTQTYTFWTLCVGFAVTMSGASCADQAICQRYLACKTTTQARLANFTALIPTVLVMGSSLLTGCLLYAYYQRCYPLFSGEIEKPDQLLPRMALEVSSSLPGFTGWFVSGLFSGALSTVSSGLNSLSMLAMEDFAAPLFPRMTQRMKLVMSKALVVVFGLVTLAVAFLFSKTQSTFIETYVTMSGCIVGPVLGLFTLGAFVPWANTKGAICGQVVATTFGLWMGIGSYLYPKPLELQGIKELGQQCEKWDLDNLPQTPVTFNGTLATSVYAVSPFYYSTVAVFLVVFVGTVVSFLTTPTKPRDLDPLVFVPVADVTWMPSSWRRFLRFGVPPITTKDDGTRRHRNHLEKMPLPPPHHVTDYKMAPLKDHHDDAA